MNQYTIPEVFKSNDTIYHYCNANVALEHILFSGKIRLSQRKGSCDPIENVPPWFTLSSVGEINNDDSWKIEQLSQKKISNTKQLCFCMNQIDNTSGYSTFKPYDFYGFLKPRMWDQYGDKYRGVCLAFSLSKLKREPNTFLSKNVEYITYREFEHKLHSIDCNRLHTIGFDEYWAEFSKFIERQMFYKHSDYNGENEYRFISFSDNQYDYIEITSSLLAIFVSEQANDYIKDALRKYADEHDLELYFVKWDFNGPQITSSIKLEQLKREILDDFKKLDLTRQLVQPSNPAELIKG